MQHRGSAAIFDFCAQCIEIVRMVGTGIAIIDIEDEPASVADPGGHSPFIVRGDNNTKPVWHCDRVPELGLE